MAVNARTRLERLEHAADAREGAAAVIHRTMAKVLGNPAAFALAKRLRDRLRIEEDGVAGFGEGLARDPQARRMADELRCCLAATKVRQR